MESTDLAIFCEAVVPTNAMSLKATAHQLEVVSAFFIASAQTTAPREYEEIPPYLLEYVKWMQSQSTRSKIETLLKGNTIGKKLLEDVSYREDFLRDLAGSTTEEESYVRVGSNLTQILSGEVHPTKILSEEEQSANSILVRVLPLATQRLGHMQICWPAKTLTLRSLKLGLETILGRRCSCALYVHLHTAMTMETHYAAGITLSRTGLPRSSRTLPNVSRSTPAESASLY